MFGAAAGDLLGIVTRALTRAAVPYMVTGSVAASLHGAPRGTQDLDIVIDPDSAGLDRLLSEFPAPDYYVSRDAAVTALRNAGMFNVVDFHTGWKIDFVLRKPRDFSVEEFHRRREVSLLGHPTCVVTAEDLLIAKLEWSKLGESERQLRDAAGIVRTQGDDLDTAYIDAWVERLGLRNQWLAARNLAK